MLIARTCLRLVTLMGCLIIAAHPTETGAAAPFPLPSSLYPAHTRITVLEPLSNAQMDCDWGFDCQGGQPVTTAPMFHLHTEDELHRVAGWAQFGDAAVSGSRMLFAVFASAYDPASSDGLPGNMMAFSDFRLVLMMQGYIDLLHYPHLTPRGIVGNSGVQFATSHDGDVLAMSCWTGTTEVEGMVIYRHGSPIARHLAMHDLSQQVRAALTELGIGDRRSGTT